jgi:hypothetical protein
MTAIDIITTSMRRINAIPPGENPTADEADAALRSLNAMVDSWLTERLMLYAVVRREFFPPPQPAYTVGPGADIDIPRPVRIDRFGVILLTNPMRPLELPMNKITEAEWRRIPVKDVPSSVPRDVWDDNGFPWRTLSLWPQPMLNIGIVLYMWGQLTQFQDLATDYQFPPGYQDALEFSLPLRLSLEFGGFVPQALPAMAVAAIAKVKAVNTPLMFMRCDDALIADGRKMYNWLTDTPIGYND